MAASRSSALTVTLPSDREVVMIRVFDAPRQLVFETHSKAEHTRRWWGQRNSTMTVCEMDFQAGGPWRFVLRDAEGNEFGFRGEFREIVPPERIVWTFEFEGMPGHVVVETLTFDEHDGKTTLTATSVYASKDDRDGMLQSGMEEGARETWDRLAEYVATMTEKTRIEQRGRELFIERVFDAPRALVWKAWTEAEHLSQWWGPKGWTVPYCKVDFRPGGVWHYCMQGPDGTAAWGKAVYREIAAPQRLVYVDYFSDAEGNALPGMPETLITMEFIEQGDKTKVRTRAEYVSVEALETVLAMGMIQGMTETLDRLEQHLAEM